MKMAGRWRLTGRGLLFAGLALAAVPGLSGVSADQSIAELRSHHITSAGTSIEVPWSPVILEVQTALARLGFYKGSIDGRDSIATGYAVRVYRKVHGLDGASGDWGELLAHLEAQTAEGAEIESRLDRARRTQIKAAREILDQRIELQTILHGSAPAADDSDAESYGCLVIPNADCLFRTAMESAGSVVREEYRNWALRDLIRAQALAGRYDAALASLKKLTDPRLIFVALREIAEAMAGTGRFEKALETARLIPEPNHRARAMVSIATALAVSRQYLQAREVGEEATRLLARERDVADRVMTAAGFAEDVADAGDRHHAAALLKSAAGDLAGADDGPARDAAWARLARAQLAIGNQTAAAEALGNIADARSRSGVAVGGALRRGEPGRATQLLASVDDLRYRVLALCDVAWSHHRTGDVAGAASLLTRAAQLVEEVDSPYAGSFARARIAETLAKLGQFDAAEEAAMRIADDALRARTLWAVSERRRAAGDVAGSERSERRAIAVAGAAMSAFDRTAVLGDIAVSLARAGRIELAREAYTDALQATRRIKIDWWRARALARAAGTLHELESWGVF